MPTKVSPPSAPEREATKPDKFRNDPLRITLPELPEKPEDAPEVTRETHAPKHVCRPGSTRRCCIHQARRFIIEDFIADDDALGGAFW